jgi:hypothetical protein
MFMSDKSNRPAAPGEIIAGTGGKKNMNNKAYEKPSITTYSEDEVIEIIGPANTAGSPFFSGMHGSMNGPMHGHGNGHGHRH